MEMFFFDVTYRVTSDQGVVDVIAYKGCRAETEHEARREILTDWIARGFNVRRMERVKERGREY